MMGERGDIYRRGCLDYITPLYSSFPTIISTLATLMYIHSFSFIFISIQEEEEEEEEKRGAWSDSLAGFFGIL